MANNKYQNIALDARPDRLDLRDREYRPHLRSLPPQYPTEGNIESYLDIYVNTGLILDQGKEGACTGFGLAAVINFLNWKNEIEADENDTPMDSLNAESIKVSERMLYHMAQVYDEWDGEDYSGSSCRGAMKGWHRHGVCKKNLWEYDLNGKFLKPEDGWAQDAVNTPLGAYYRINKDSVVDMQAAIFEVGAIYCSANAHQGWWLKQVKTLPVIPQNTKITGGHAFAIVGYNPTGFIVQNSWGESWGYRGFAILSYQDWVEHGSDAWVSARGVPVSKEASPTTFSNHPMQSVSTDSTARASAGIRKALNYDYQNPQVRPWSEQQAYQHSLVLGNNGRPKLTIVSAEDADASAWHICYEQIKNWMEQKKSNRKIAVYAHGGLNAEEVSINRIRVMAPYFKENGIYPLFITWKTGVGETLSNMVQEHFDNIFSQSGIDPSSQRAEGILDRLAEPVDRAIESLARSIKARGIWSEMKENAVYASDRAVPGFPQNAAGKAGGMVILAKALEQLNTTFSGMEVHLAGHSAGSIILGAWMKELEQRSLTAHTLSLYAPACTTEFANRHFIRAVDKGVLDVNNIYIHMMDDERELADQVGRVYHKSLLYLVSRALESLHKMPILGMAASWDDKHFSNHPNNKGKFHESQINEMKKWKAFIEQGRAPVIYKKDKRNVVTNLNNDTIDLAHGSFDNDISVVEHTLKKIRRTGIKYPVENLAGF